MTFNRLPASLVAFLFSQNQPPLFGLYHPDQSRVPTTEPSFTHTSAGFVMTVQVTAAAILAGGTPGGQAVLFGRIDRYVTGGGQATFISCAIALPVPYDAPPRAPADLFAVVLSSTSVRLDWRPGGHEYGFAVFDAVSGQYVAHPTSSRFTLTHLAPTSYYCAAVIAWNNAGWSGWSNWTCFTTPDVPTMAPAGPLGLTATAVDSTHIELDWSGDSAGADGFTIVDFGTGAIVGTADPGVSSFVLADLQPNTQYCATVMAFNSAGSSAPSNQACATTPP